MMTAIKASTRAYENWLRDQIGADFVSSRPYGKHQKMRDSPFAFLRASYWRWAETILESVQDCVLRPKSSRSAIRIWRISAHGGMPRVG